MHSKTMAFKRFRYDADNILLCNNNNCLSVMAYDRPFENKIMQYSL